LTYHDRESGERRKVGLLSTEIVLRLVVCVSIFAAVSIFALVPAQAQEVRIDISGGANCDGRSQVERFVALFASCGERDV
jgi:hypothetical protein